MNTHNSNRGGAIFQSANDFNVTKHDFCMEMAFNSNFAVSKLKNLSVVDRSIRDENRMAILRRREFAARQIVNENKIVEQCFPSQRALLELLCVLDEEQALELADCALPLFTIRLPFAEHANPKIQSQTQEGVASPSAEEVAMALLSRLDSLRSAHVQAAMLYDLNSAQAAFIGRHTPRELNHIAKDPAVVLLPTVSDEYFQIAATTKMTTRERTVLAGTSRRKVH